MYRTKLSSRIVESGDSLEEQADELAKWTAEAIAAVPAIDPDAYVGEDAGDTDDAAL